MIDYPVFDEQGRPVVQSAEGGRPAVPPGQTEQPGNRPDTPPGHDENHPGNKPETPPGQEKPKPGNDEEDEEEEATPKEKGRYADSPLSVMAVDEVDGAYNLDEVHVLHLAGPYAGMTLVHRKDAEGLAEAHAAGLVLGPVGYDPNETSELTSTLYEEDGETPINSSPSSYPHSAVLSLSGKTAGNAAPRGRRSPLTVRRLLRMFGRLESKPTLWMFRSRRRGPTISPFYWTRWIMRRRTLT